MKFANDQHSYGVVTKILHWSTALLIITLIALGWYMVDLSYFDRWYNGSLALHKALGMVVFACGVLTLAWRGLSHSPVAVASLKPWERIASTAMHCTLMVLVLALPISGYLISTSAGKSIEIFGWFDVPAVLPVSARLRDSAITIHFYMAYATAGLVALHAAAALKHQFFDRDGTLARMLWR